MEREADIVFEGQRDSGGSLSGKFSLSRACSSQGSGEIWAGLNEPYSRTTVQRSWKITSKRGKKTQIVKHHSSSVLLQHSSCQPRTKASGFFWSKWQHDHGRAVFSCPRPPSCVVLMFLWVMRGRTSCWDEFSGDWVDVWWTSALAGTGDQLDP